MLSSHREDTTKNVKILSLHLLTLLLTRLEVSQVLVTTCITKLVYTNVTSNITETAWQSVQKKKLQLLMK